MRGAGAVWVTASAMLLSCESAEPSPVASAPAASTGSGEATELVISEGVNVRKVDALLIGKGYKLSGGSTTVGGDFDVEAKKGGAEVRVKWSSSAPGASRDMMRKFDADWTAASGENEEGVLAVGFAVDKQKDAAAAKKLLAEVLARFADPTLPYAVVKPTESGWLAPTEEVVDNHRVIDRELAGRLRGAMFSLGSAKPGWSEQRVDRGNPKDTGSPGVGFNGTIKGGDYASISVRCVEEGSQFVPTPTKAAVGQAIYIAGPCHVLVSVGASFTDAPETAKSQALLERLLEMPPPKTETNP